LVKLTVGAVKIFLRQAMGERLQYRLDILAFGQAFLGQASSPA